MTPKGDAEGADPFSLWGTLWESGSGVNVEQSHTRTPTRDGVSSSLCAALPKMPLPRVTPGFGFAGVSQPGSCAGGMPESRVLGALVSM